MNDIIFALGIGFCIGVLVGILICKIIVAFGLGTL